MCVICTRARVCGLKSPIDNLNRKWCTKRKKSVKKICICIVGFIFWWTVQRTKFCNFFRKSARRIPSLFLESSWRVVVRWSENYVFDRWLLKCNLSKRIFFFFWYSRKHKILYSRRIFRLSEINVWKNYRIFSCEKITDYG